MEDVWVRSISLCVMCAALAMPAAAQSPVPQQQPPAAARDGEPGGVSLPPGYVIGTDDVLTIVFWRDKEMSADAVVRPDGLISLPLINEVQAAGLTPEQLRESLVKAASKFLEEPTASVVVKQINSRKVYLTGMVTKAGSYPLTGNLNVLQLIAEAGGLQEYADSKHIVIVRNEAGRETRFKFNYNDVVKGKNVEQNMTLKPGDTVIVP